MSTLTLKRALFVLRLIVVVSLSIGLTGFPIIKTAKAIPDEQTNVAFFDDFSTNPNTNGKWRIFREHPTQPNTEGFWDQAGQKLYLTTSTSNRAVAAIANYALTSRTWEAEFDYWVGPGGTGADGFVFLFYKNEVAYRDGGLGWGGSLGFDLGGCYNDASRIAGYGVEFDNFRNGECSDPSDSHIAIIEDKASTHLVFVNDSRTEDSMWHRVLIQFDNGHIIVYVNGSPVIDTTITNIDYTYSGIGFSSATGAWSNNHIIDNFVIRSSIGRQIVVTGCFLYVAPDGVQDLSYARVEIWDENTTTSNQLLYITYAGADGCYEAPVVSTEVDGPDLYAKVYTRDDQRVWVGTSARNIDTAYSARTSTRSNVTGGTVNFGSSINFDPGSDAPYIYDLIADKAWNYLKNSVDWDNNFNELGVEFPYGGTEGTKFYDGDIYLAAADGEDPDVILHEYSHFVMYKTYALYPNVGNCLPHYWQIPSNNGCAWSEGWANFLQGAIQNDQYYVDTENHTLNIDMESADTPAGPDVEGAVSQALWDIFDNQSENWDAIPINGTYFNGIWNIFFNYKPGDINEFRSAWLNSTNGFNDEVEAIFAHHGIGSSVPVYTINIVRDGTGNGRVTSTPPGIDCGFDCVEGYVTNSNVILTAAADSGSTFMGWSGGGCSGTGSCTVIVTADTSITANFSTTNVDVYIGAELKGQYFLSQNESTRQSYVNVNNGPVQITSTDGSNLISALRVIWQEPGLRFSYSEMMGLPKEQLSSEYWFPWYNNLDTTSMDQGFRIGNVDTTSHTIRVFVEATQVGADITLASGGSTRVAYPINSGPIRIVCTTCTNPDDKIIAALRVIWQEPGFRSSYWEILGLPKEQLSSEYWFPWYNNLATNSMDQGFRIANVDTTSGNTVEVWVGDTQLDTINLGSGASTRVSYSVDDGPIRIICTTCTNGGNDKIIAALRVIWKEPGFRSSYSEMMGLPKEQLSTEYWFPWYNNLATNSMDQGFRIANVDTTSHTIKVFVGATQVGIDLNLAGGGSTRVGYPVDNGPIRIICTTCTNPDDKIIVALRVIWQEPGFRSSYAEMMGLPKEQLSTEYWFPWYNNFNINSMDQGLRFGVP